MNNEDNADLNDEEFIRSFENCTLPPERFHHGEHIRLTWLYLGRHGPLQALARVSEAISRYASFHGKADRYHETITWAYFFLIRERIVRLGPEKSWAEFAAANTDLFDWKNTILNSYYREETLASDTARKTFVLPDKSTRNSVAGS